MAMLIAAPDTAAVAAADQGDLETEESFQSLATFLDHRRSGVAAAH